MSRLVRHLTFVIHSLRPGGAERVASTVVNWWANSGIIVTLITLASPDEDFYPIDPRVRRISLYGDCASSNWQTFLTNNSKRISRLSSSLHSVAADVILSFGDTTNVLVLLSSLGSTTPIVVSEHTDPRKHSIGRFPALLRRTIYKRADTVVVLTQGIAEWAKTIVPAERIQVIPNPISNQFLDIHQPPKSDRRIILAMGRMGHEKGFDLLLDAFARIANKHPDWQLRIIGDGSERDNLRALAERLGIKSRVELGHLTRQPEIAFRQADLFVLSSRYEGFPMALLEAMTSGLPVIAFDCQSGPRELIHDGIDGLLVPAEDVDALAASMDGLMNSPFERERLAARAPEAADRFALPKVMAMWDTVLDNAVARGRNTSLNYRIQ